MSKWKMGVSISMPCGAIARFKHGAMCVGHDSAHLFSCNLNIDLGHRPRSLLCRSTLVYPCMCPFSLLTCAGSLSSHVQVLLSARVDSLASASLLGSQTLLTGGAKNKVGRLSQSFEFERVGRFERARSRSSKQRMLTGSSDKNYYLQKFFYQISMVLLLTKIMVLFFLLLCW